MQIVGGNSGTPLGYYKTDGKTSVEYEQKCYNLNVLKASLGLL